ncbi:hypothetical protein J1N35_042209 [Gossypium stocksii]|uniref:Uncharacterized protein n=1 Tax=Gossypium stocksii TaxID=47602 RepID=A0A9D3ZK71_9ROSI|nr:hypothetical protein J1N35_042209 [Gossypium stocksii]
MLLRLQHLLLFKRNTQPLLDTPLVGGKTWKRPCLVVVWNTQLLHDTPLVDGTYTSQSTFDWGRYETSTKRDDILLTTFIGDRTSYVVDDDGPDDESNMDPLRKSGPDGIEVALFSKSEPVPTIPEDVEGGSDEEEEDSQFRAYSPPAHMHNVDLS